MSRFFMVHCVHTLLSYAAYACEDNLLRKT